MLIDLICKIDENCYPRVFLEERKRVEDDFHEPFLHDNFLSNKLKQRPKISIFSRLAYNPKNCLVSWDYILI